MNDSHQLPRILRNPRAAVSANSPAGIGKTRTGIERLDHITGGGLPDGRPPLVFGGPGCGKTMLAAEFLVRGATRLDEPAVFMLFEESASELTENLRSLGFDLDSLYAEKKIVLDHVPIERSEIEETGEYEREGLFTRLGQAIDSIGAKRVVLDTLKAPGWRITPSYARSCAVISAG